MIKWIDGLRIVETGSSSTVRLGDGAILRLKAVPGGGGILKYYRSARHLLDQESDLTVTYPYMSTGVSAMVAFSQGYNEAYRESQLKFAHIE